jgi:Hpt domain.
MTLHEQPEIKPQPDLAAALNRLWIRFLPEMSERVAILQLAANACAESELSREIREKAHAAAHKLAGTLGTFSLARGTELAREFEKICEVEIECTSEQAALLSSLTQEIASIIDQRG